MKRNAVHKPWGSPASYSQATYTESLIFTCGQVGAAVDGDAVPFHIQAETALRRLVDVVEAAGGNASTILKVNGYLADFADFPTYDRIYREIIGVEPKPARTTVQVAGLPAPILLEIDAVAARSV